MDELKYNQYMQKLMEERMESRRKISSVLLPTFSAILAVSCTYGISTSNNIDFSLLGINVYCLSLLANTIGLISCVALLYENVDACNQILSTLHRRREMILRSKGPSVVLAKHRKIFSLLEVITYVCFVLTVSSLVVYALRNRF